MLLSSEKQGHGTAHTHTHTHSGIWMDGHHNANTGYLWDARQCLLHTFSYYEIFLINNCSGRKKPIIHFGKNLFFTSLSKLWDPDNLTMLLSPSGLSSFPAPFLTLKGSLLLYISATKSSQCSVDKPASSWFLVLSMGKGDKMGKWNPRVGPFIPWGQKLHWF